MLNYIYIYLKRVMLNQKSGIKNYLKWSINEKKMKYVKVQLRDLENRIRMFSMFLVEILKEEDIVQKRENVWIDNNIENYIKF